MSADISCSPCPSCYSGHMNTRRGVHAILIVLIISALAFGGVAKGEGGGANSTRANAGVPASPVATYANTGSPLGIELNGIFYYSSEQPFLNIMKTGSWVTSSTSAYNTGEENLLQLDADGYPTSMLGPGGIPVTFTMIQTPLLLGLPSPYYPAGHYVSCTMVRGLLLIPSPPWFPIPRAAMSST